MKNFLSRFVDTNEREIRRLRPIIDEINGLEPELQALSDNMLLASFCALGQSVPIPMSSAMKNFASHFSAAEK